MIRLYILGSAELRKADKSLDHSFLAGAKRLALLSYLVLNHSRGFLRRDHLLPLLWPNQGQKRARNSLSNMLYHIRKSLGNEVIETRGTEELKLNRNVIWCDAIAFEQELDNNAPEKALKIYRGTLLEGFHVPNGSPDLGQWLDYKRERIRSRFLDALEILAIRAEEKGRFDEASEWWKKKAHEDPFDTRVAKKLSFSLALSGKYAEARQFAREHALFMEKEMDADAGKVIQELTENLKKIRSDGSKEINLSKKETRSVAVLPFEELAQHKETVNFASGLHHDLLTRLSGVAGLKIISRTSVLQYKNTGKSIRQIADELGVDTVVEGGVQQSGAQMRLHVQVIDAESDGHKVAETYDRKLTSFNLFDVQSELAEKITSVLKAYLTPNEKKRISEWLPTDNIEAYRFYTMGRKELDQRTEKSMRKSLHYFERAVELDPDYTLARVGQGDAFTLLYDYGYDSAGNTLPKAETAIKKALELDPHLAEAHASLGLLYSNRHQGPDSIRELLTAVDLKPSYAEAHNWLSWNYQLLGKAEKALESARHAVELNPLSPEAVSNLSVSLLYNGYIGQALSEAQRAMELQPEWATPAFYKGLALCHMGRFTECLSTLSDLRAPWAGVGPLATAALCHVFLEDKKQVREIHSRFKKNGNLFAEGLLYAAMSNIEKATDCFLKVDYWDDWPTLAIYYLYPKVLNKIREDERYSRIIRHVKTGRGEILPPLPDTAKPDRTSIAVLPFENLGDGKKSSYFTDGFHYDLITMLSRISAITVISSDSVRKLSAGDTNTNELARQLDVGTIIKGSVQIMQNRLRLNMLLIDVNKENVQWAETFDRRLTAKNLFDIQTELAEKITDSLRNKLTIEEKEKVTGRPTEYLDAYLLYVQGRTHVAKRTKDSVLKAYDFFRQALTKDPEYALALCGLAEAIAIGYVYHYSLPDQNLDPFTIAGKAIEINPSLGEAYTALGILYAHNQNAPAAINEFIKAIRLTPGYSDAHIWLGWIKMVIGEVNGAVEPAERAVELNPMVPFTHAFLGEIYLAAGRFESALKEARAARELQSNYGVAHFMEGLSLFHLNRFSEAAFVIGETTQHISEKDSPSLIDVKAVQAVIALRNGYSEDAENLLSEIENEEIEFPKGLLYAAMGNSEEAFTCFEKIKQWRPFPTAITRYMFPEILNPIRNNSRFNKILHQINKSWHLE